MKTRASRPVNFPGGLWLHLTLLVSVLLVSASAETPPARQSELPPALAPYAALGSSFAQTAHLTELGWNDAQIAAFLQGMDAAFHGQGYPLDDSARRLATEIARKVQENATRKPVSQATDGNVPAAYWQEMRKRHALQMSATGLAYKISPGLSGVRPRPGDTVVISLVALAADGVTQIPTLTFKQVRYRMAELLPGLREALQMMTVEGQAHLILPPALSFGGGAWPTGVERDMPLHFVVTLHEVINP